MRSQLAIVAGAALALAACSGPMTTITYVDNETRYDPGTIGWAAQDGELNTVVRGNPFPASVEAETIAAGLRLPGWFPSARLTTRPADRRRAEHRLVLVFNPVRDPLGGAAACGDVAGVALAPPGPTMRVQLAFCSGAKVDAEAILAAPTGRDPADPGFAGALNGALAVMLPPRYRSHGDGGPPFRKR
jgi:hypothetical protein